MTTYFSATTCGFYDDYLKDNYLKAGSWPSDAREVTAEELAIYTTPPETGKKLGSDSSGSPAWVDVPPPTAEELIEKAKEKQAVLMAEAKDTISIWQSELLLGTISDDDKASLTAWISYINELQALDFSSITDEASYDAFVWPDAPESSS
ncbi:tail fiber assembly protein [Mangrovibacter plantisponsor]|uniref:Virus tail fiber assembly protein lambda gpK n=1 Tax=Mangrovibacter plantisponsor TaxID=451513 RepID=A0A317PYR2_9ENTR|nr:tail fiber assembly protein [Mangrovibacter plantisponsor]PWW07830.1 virus tail fiber assembly protein lambda gpK [Mangrovibacter plantisponsor]